MGEAKDILGLTICVLAVYTASALFVTGIYFILRKQWKKQNTTSRRGSDSHSDGHSYTYRDTQAASDTPSPTPRAAGADNRLR
jgi:hypothetical protein